MRSRRAALRRPKLPPPAELNVGLLPCPACAGGVAGGGHRLGRCGRHPAVQARTLHGRLPGRQVVQGEGAPACSMLHCGWMERKPKHASCGSAPALFSKPARAPSRPDGSRPWTRCVPAPRRATTRSSAWGSTSQRCAAGGCALHGMQGLFGSMHATCLLDLQCRCAHRGGQRRAFDRPTPSCCVLHLVVCSHAPLCAGRQAAGPPNVTAAAAHGGRQGEEPGGRGLRRQHQPRQKGGRAGAVVGGSQRRCRPTHSRLWPGLWLPRMHVALAAAHACTSQRCARRAR